MRTKVLLLAAVFAALLAQPVLAEPKPTEAGAPETTLEGRAIYPAELRGQGSLPAPDPFPDQPVGGYSALLDARGKDTYLAMPDNGYGSKANSADFILRVDRVRVDYETAKGGSGDVEVSTPSACATRTGRSPSPSWTRTDRASGSLPARTSTPNQ